MSKESSSDSASDLAVSPDQKVPMKQAKPSEAPTGHTKRNLLLAAGGLGLLLLGLGVGLAIGLPLAFKGRNRGQQSAVELSAGDQNDGGAAALRGTTRTYYLAADPINWDYLPAGKNLCSGQDFTDEQALYVSKGAGTKYKKAVYRQYTDDSFQVRG